VVVRQVPAWPSGGRGVLCYATRHPPSHFVPAVSYLNTCGTPLPFTAFHADRLDRLDRLARVCVRAIVGGHLSKFSLLVDVRRYHPSCLPFSPLAMTILAGDHLLCAILVRSRVRREWTCEWRTRDTYRMRGRLGGIGNKGESGKDSSIPR